MSDTTDKRLHDRELLKGQLTEEQLRSEALAGPDQAANLEPTDEEGATRLRDELVSEKKARDERIHRALTSPPPRPVPLHAPAPLDDEI